MNGSNLIRLNEKWLQTVGCCKVYDLITAFFFFLILLLLFSGFEENAVCLKQA